MPTGKADNAITFSFSNPSHSMPSNAELEAALVAGGAETADAPSAASDSEPAAAATPAVSGSAKPAAEAATSDTDDSTAASASAEPAATATADPKTYTIKVDGKELVVTERDLLDGHMRHRDYTQKTQRLADQERVWNTEKAQLQQELQAIDTFLRDKAAVEAYQRQVFGASPATAPATAPQIDPTKPLTVQDVAAISRYNAEQVRQHTEQLINQRFQQAVQASQSAASADRVRTDALRTIESQVDDHIEALLDQYPALKKFEDIEDTLIGDAYKYNPTSIDDARSQLTAAAERRVAIINSLVDDQKKASAIAAAKLKNQGPEGPGGTAPKTAPGKKLTFASGDRKALLAAAEADLRAALAS